MHEEALPVAAGAVCGEVSDEVTDLSQRLSVLQSKRVEDKARIKELEKYKAHYLQAREFKVALVNGSSSSFRLVHEMCSLV